MSEVADMALAATDIPDGWRAAQLGDISRIVTGKTPSTKEPRYWGGNIPFVTPSDITNGPWLRHVERYLSDEGMNYSSVVPAGSVLFTCIASIGKSCITHEVSTLNQQINACVPFAQVDAYFLYNALQARVGDMLDLAGTTAVPIINKSTFSKVAVKGENQTPLYKFLTEKESNGKLAGEIKWNFEKFLIDRHGDVVARFPSKVKPTDPAFIEMLESLGQLALCNRFLKLALESNKWQKWMLPDSQATDRDRAIIAGHYVFASPEFKQIKSEAAINLKMSVQDIDRFLQKSVRALLLRHLRCLGALPQLSVERKSNGQGHQSRV